jgi:arylsulfatase A-like enzyme
VKRAGWAALAAFLLAGALGNGPPPAFAGRRAASGMPNIILIVTDDQRDGTLWAMPDLRADLSSEGVRFRNTFVVNPTCCPSRASILTGRYSHGTGVYANGGPYGGYAAFDPSSTIATWLHDAGYHTALVGKYLNGYTGTSIPPGWDTFDAFNEDPEAGLYYDYSMNVSGTEQTFGGSDADYSTTVLSQMASGFIQASADPFFLYLAPRAPHAPATPATPDQGAFAALPPWRPPSYDEADVSDKPPWVRRHAPLSADDRAAIDGFRKSQYETLLSIDRMIGDLVTELDREGRLHDTAILFTSDNGFLWGEHRLTGKGFPYEESIRVPLVIRDDAIIPQPAADHHLALNIDLAPTIAALAGVTPTTPVEGRSLVPFLDGSGAGWRNRFLIEHLGGTHPPTYCAVRSTHEIFVAYATGREELYDLRRDPSELENVVRQRVLRRARLLTWLQELCDPPPPGFTVPSG